MSDGANGTPGNAGGAGIANGNRATFIHCTITRNRLAVNAGGTRSGAGIWARAGTNYLLNTLLAEHPDASDVTGTVTSLGHNFVAVSNGSSGWTNSDSLGLLSTPLPSPILRFDGFTMLPRPGSAVIDAGADYVLNPPFSLSTDQRGRARRTGSHVDIGAVETDFALIAGIRIAGSQANISFVTDQGFPYHVESKDALAPGSWTIIPGSTRVGDGTVFTVTDPRPLAPRRFYRAVLEED
jgi:hypothetical protein